MEVRECKFDEIKQLYMSDNHCGVLKSAVFEECHKLIDPEPYIKACVAIDACAWFGSPYAIAKSVAAYAENCRRKGVILNKEWRTVTHIRE